MKIHIKLYPQTLEEEQCVETNLIFDVYYSNDNWRWSLSNTAEFLADCGAVQVTHNNAVPLLKDYIYTALQKKHTHPVYVMTAAVKIMNLIRGTSYSKNSIGIKVHGVCFSDNTPVKYTPDRVVKLFSVLTNDLSLEVNIMLDRFVYSRAPISLLWHPHDTDKFYNLTDFHRRANPLLDEISDLIITS